jgi:hypothetical protein
MDETIMSKRNYHRFHQDPWKDEVYKPTMTAKERHHLSPAETYKRILEARKQNKWLEIL